LLILFLWMKRWKIQTTAQETTELSLVNAG